MRCAAVCGVADPDPLYRHDGPVSAVAIAECGTDHRQRRG